jgi:hypothetical protein
MKATEATFAAAESGVNEALYRLLIDPSIQNFQVTQGTETVGVTIERDGVDRRVTAAATDLTGKKRTLQIIARTSSFGGGFSSAIQAGDGGIIMDNNSWVSGHVFSNGSILGGTKTVVAGSATVASVGGIPSRIVSICTGQRTGTGNCQADSSDRNMHAHTIEKSTIWGNAYYQTIYTSGSEASEVRGSVCTSNPSCFPGTADADPLPQPITDADIDRWKNEVDGIAPFDPNPTVPLGPSALGECPAAYDDGTYRCIMSDTTLGLQKIDANLYVKGDAKLTLTANVWVTGNIIFGNAGAGSVSVHPSLGIGSVVFLADGVIDISNNYAFNGSGDPRSFILILSTNTAMNVIPPAIYASNGSNSLILSAPHGEIRVKNGGQVNASAAKLIHLEETSAVIYNANIASFIVVAGSGENIMPDPSSWHEVIGPLP